MTIHLLGLVDETLRLSDGCHSQLITRENNCFTLADGQRAFFVEQLSTAPEKPRGGWGLYLCRQILTAIPRALPIRRLIYQRCNPILLTANITVAPCRYEQFTLFFTPGGYSKEIHTFQPPRLEGDAQLSIEYSKYASDEVNLRRAIKEETMSQLGNYVNLLAIPLVLFALFFLWFYRVLFHLALSLLPISGLFCLYFWKKSKIAKDNLREKVADTVRHLNGDL